MSKLRIFVSSIQLERTAGGHMNPQLSATTPTGIRNWTISPTSCATPSPRLVRVQDPFGSLLARAKRSALISAKAVLEAGQGVA